MKLIVREMIRKDQKPYKELFGEAYNEYLENLRQNDPLLYQKEK